MLFVSLCFDPIQVTSLPSLPDLGSTPLSYVNSNGHALVDGEHYLPKEWTNNKKRMKKAGIPKDKQRYITRHETFMEVLKLHGPKLAHEWIAGDDELGRPIEFLGKLNRMGEKYMLAVPSSTKTNVLSLATDEQCIPSVRSSVQVSQWAARQEKVHFGGDRREVSLIPG